MRLQICLRVMRLQIFIQAKYLKSVICLSVIIDSIFKKHELLSQVILKEYKYIEKERKVIRYSTDGLKVSSVYSNESDEE